MPTLTFWYEFASTYSYLSAMRIEKLAGAAGVAVVWRPFLLGPIFKQQGWPTSPFNIYPAKGRYMVRDIERIAASRGLAFRMPNPFPASSLLAARVALVGVEEGWVAPLSRAIFDAEFARGADIASGEVVAGLLRSLSIEAGPVLERAQSPEIKQKLKDNTDAARQVGLFGAPTFETEDKELFWGDDRLEQALAWAARI